MGAQHFFLGNRHLGVRQIPTMRIVPGLEIRPHHSYAYFCMRCGDIWARLAHDKAELTQCLVQPCRRHGDGQLGCHPNWSDEPRRVESDWPVPALQYELETVIQLIEHGDRTASPGFRSMYGSS